MNACPSTEVERYHFMTGPRLIGTIDPRGFLAVNHLVNGQSPQIAVGAGEAMR